MNDNAPNDILDVIAMVAMATLALSIFTISR